VGPLDPPLNLCSLTPPFEAAVLFNSRVRELHGLPHGLLPEVIYHSTMEKEAKETLFRDLYQLDEEESEVEDSSNAVLTLKNSRTPPSTSLIQTRAPHDKPNHSTRPTLSLQHMVSAPLPLNQLTTLAGLGRPNVSRSFQSTMCPISPIRQVLDTSNSVSKAGVKGTSLIPRTGKRKRGRSLEPKPESQQIFLGLSFCNQSLKSSMSEQTLTLYSLPSQ